MDRKQYYYYSTLTSNEQRICDSIVDGAMSLKRTVSILNAGFDKNSISKIFDVIDKDFPELFYLDISHTSVTCIFMSITVKLAYLYSDNDIEDMRQRITRKVNSFTKNIPSGASVTFKEKIIHDYLTKNAEYAHGGTEMKFYSIAGIFLDGRAVCEGYAKAFKYLCSMLNIVCIVVSGTASDKFTGTYGPHAWNIIKTDEQKFFHVDVTWDSCCFHSNAYNYMFYNLSDDSISTDHEWNKDSVPACINDSEKSNTASCRTEKDLEETICSNIRNNILSFKVTTGFSFEPQYIFDFTRKVLQDNNIFSISKYDVLCVEDRKFIQFDFKKR